MALEPGTTASRTITVEESQTATEVGSGDVPVLATPVVLAIAEGVCVETVAAALPEGSTTVGTWVELTHSRPSRVGAEVTWQARLTEVDGRRLTFNVEVTQDGTSVARVHHRRAIVDRDRFLGSL